MPAETTMGPDIPMLNQSPDELARFFRDTFVEQGVRTSDLPSVTVPAGDSQTYRWEVPIPLGEESEIARSLIGIVVLYAMDRAYWPVGLQAGGAGMRPSCASRDAITGYGWPAATSDQPYPEDQPRATTQCAQCPNSQWGSATDGRSQACKERGRIFLLTERGPLPYAISVPRRSLAGIRKFETGLLAAGKRWEHAVTELTLEPVQNQSGIKHPIVRARFLGSVEPERTEAATTYRGLLSYQLRREHEEALAPPDEAPGMAPDEAPGTAPEEATGNAKSDPSDRTLISGQFTQTHNAVTYEPPAA